MSSERGQAGARHMEPDGVHLVKWSVNQRSLELSHLATLRTSLQAVQRGACVESASLSMCVASFVVPVIGSQAWQHCPGGVECGLASCCQVPRLATVRYIGASIGRAAALAQGASTSSNAQGGISINIADWCQLAGAPRQFLWAERHYPCGLTSSHCQASQAQV